jgi:hypothetical protein
MFKVVEEKKDKFLGWISPTSIELLLFLTFNARKLTKKATIGMLATEVHFYLYL